MAGLILFLVLAAGFAVQRGSTCAVGAMEALIEERRPQRFLAFLACGAIALAVMASGALLGLDRFEHHPGSSAILPATAGGAIFGGGAWLNGRCAFGTIAGLGTGQAARLGTLAGFFLGFLLASRLGLHHPAPDLVSPLAASPPWAVLIAAIAVGGGLALLFRPKAGFEPEGAEWDPMAALALIGLVNGVLLVLATGWPYTNLLMDLAGSTGMDFAWRSLMAATFIAGSIAGAVSGHRFRPRLGRASLWGRCLAGGMLMGVGATLVPGGNDTMLLVGLPLLLPNLLAAYVAMNLILAVLIAVGKARQRLRGAATA